MNHQKGSAIVVVLVVFVIGFIIYSSITGSGPSVIDELFGNFETTPKSQTPSSSKPAPNKATPAPTATPTPSGPDTVSPRRSNVQPENKSILPAETKQVILSLETDEKATCRYSDAASGIAYGAMQGKFAQINSTSHSALILALVNGGKYKYYIKCTDEEGNENTTDVAVSFEVALAKDTTPPVLTNPSHKGDVLRYTTKEVGISITTNEPATCRYSTKAGTSYNSMSGSFSQYDQTKQFHIKTITGLTIGKAYEFFVRCKDLSDNVNTGDVLISFSVAAQ